jgi:hypothetical protein
VRSLPSATGTVWRPGLSAEPESGVPGGRGLKPRRRWAARQRSLRRPSDSETLHPATAWPPLGRAEGASGRRLAGACGWRKRPPGLGPRPQARVPSVACGIQHPRQRGAYCQCAFPHSGWHASGAHHTSSNSPIPLTRLLFPAECGRLSLTSTWARGDVKRLAHHSLLLGVKALRGLMRLLSRL